MPLDDQAKADLRRSALDLCQRPDAAEKVPARVSALRYNIKRLEGRDGHAAETREENAHELKELLKFAAALDVPTEVPAAPAEEDNQ